MTDANYFLKNRTLFAAVYSALKDAANNMLSKHGHMLVIAYIATAIIYCNAQCPGVVHNKTVEEFQRHQSVNGKNYLYKAWITRQPHLWVLSTL